MVFEIWVHYEQNIQHHKYKYLKQYYYRPIEYVRKGYIYFALDKQHESFRLPSGLN